MVEMKAKAYAGYCVGGPEDGRLLLSDFPRVAIPVKLGPDLGEGDRGFGVHYYQWDDMTATWRWQ